MPIDQNKDINWQFSMNEYLTIREGLGEVPMKNALPLYQKLEGQVTKHLMDAQQPEGASQQSTPAGDAKAQQSAAPPTNPPLEPGQTETPAGEPAKEVTNEGDRP